VVFSGCGEEKEESGRGNQGGMGKKDGIEGGRLLVAASWKYVDVEGWSFSFLF
jgi:hypothetical protein